MILMFGPLLPPIHGQSLAFSRFYESIGDKQKIVIDTNLENSSKAMKIFATLKITFLILFKTLFLKYDIAYMTCSRSILGSLKDVLFINLVSFRKKRIINHLHGSDFYDFLHKTPTWYRKILFHTYNKIDTSIVLLENMKEQFKDFHKMRLEVVPNFYDKELENTSGKKDVKNIRLLYLSNIIKSKGIFELIDAFDDLSQKHDNIILNIAGDFMGDEFMSIKMVEKEFFKKIKNNDKVNFLGKVSGKKKIKLLQSSDIFVLPTYYKSEAFPISIIEAMVSKNAIVTTNFKYLPEIVNKKNGILVDTENTHALYQGIENLIKDKTFQQMQEFNFIHAKEKYCLDNYLGKLSKIIEKRKRKA